TTAGGQPIADEATPDGAALLGGATGERGEDEHELGQPLGTRAGQLVGSVPLEESEIHAAAHVHAQRAVADPGLDLLPDAAGLARRPVPVRGAESLEEGQAVREARSSERGLELPAERDGLFEATRANGLVDSTGQHHVVSEEALLTRVGFRPL